MWGKRDGEIIDQEESYRLLINRFYAYAKDNIRCIAISSYIDNQGKTYLASELATRLAEIGYKTLIIDANVLLPDLSKKYQVKDSMGILEAVDEIEQTVGKVPIKKLLSYAQPTEVENLYLCSRGGYLKRPYTGYIDHHAISYLFKIFKKNFMFVLIEVPSLKYLSFAQQFIEVADGYIMVVKKGCIPIKDVESLSGKLKLINGQPLGAVFNQVNDK